MVEYLLINPSWLSHPHPSSIQGAGITTFIAFILSYIITYPLYYYIRNRLHPINPLHDAILITGTSTGIGYDAVARLSALGYTVYATVRNENDAKKVKALGHNVYPYIVDVTNEQHIDSAYDAISKHLQQENKHLIALINNAGYSESQYLELLPIQRFRRQYEVNVFGQISVTKKFLPLLRDATSATRTSRLLFVTSGLANVTMSSFVPYCSSKHALRSICNGFRQELKHQHIDVIDIQPGVIETSFSANAQKTRDSMMKENENGNHRINKELHALYQPIAKKHQQHQYSKAPVSLVTTAIEHGIRDMHPLPRYLAGTLDIQLLPLANVLPDRILDWFATR